MKTTRTALILLFALLVSLFAFAQSPQSSSDQLAPGSAHLITPEALLQLIQSPGGERPLILNIGPWLIYRQAHIPDAEFIGGTADKQGLERLRTRVKPLARNKAIVLYCGCCPWGNCPNVRPAFKELSTMGFTNVKVMYIADSFGTDWVDKGYPTIKGQ